MRTILFVCTGNTCRSPMAEAIARHFIENGSLGRKTDIFVASAGIHAAENIPTSHETIETLARLGMEYAGRSKRLTAEMIRKADVVFCMTETHQQVARMMVLDSPDEIKKVLMLDPVEEIHDPIGADQNVYDALGERLMKLIPKRLKEVLSNEDRNGGGSSRT